MDSESIQKELERRDRYRRALTRRETFEQRMARFWESHEFSTEFLRKNAKGYEHFLRRNLRKRAIPDSPDAYGAR